ncbi:hypothetical protein [Pedobacter gandavensis]|uniref:M61 family metallopeptidase n=1 Tax=Pedobacter gandavensis TaxID=2679963 RepID=UPI00292D7C78|nr:hypothetical protein [Pedobacter gandavensis]
MKKTNGLTCFLLTICVLFQLSCVVSRKNMVKEQDFTSIVLDLGNVKNDQVRVEVIPTSIKSDTITYHFASIIPGTYAIADYGRFIEDISAYDKNNERLPLIRKDSNTVVIHKAKKLTRLSYLVNDTFDAETGADVFGSKEKVIFSPAGTNIKADTQFWINWAGFAGYFQGMQEKPYRIRLKHPEQLYGSTAAIDSDTSSSSDLYSFSRFAELVDNPVMYTKPDTAMFRVNDMEVLLSVYAPHGNTSAKLLKPALEKMMIAQKKFLGAVNTTKKYAVLLYLTASSDGDAKGIGALEHNNSTTAVFRENMTSQDLINVIGHEFFHTVSPLKIHSEQIRYFNYEKPVMSRHLWFYEGVTEYFANLFQVNQGLISEDKFYDLMTAKMKAAEDYNDSLSFTEMSKNVIQEDMKREYPNVYQKGALIAMCMDILLREHSNGEKGLLALEAQLAEKYGSDKPFEDADFINVITKLTFPEMGVFLNTYVVEGKPLDYSAYLKRMGLKETVVPVAESIVFVHNDALYINIDQDQKQVLVDLPDNENQFFTNLGLKNKDVLLSINGLDFNSEDGSASMMLGYGLQEGSPIHISILREGKKMELKGTVKLNYNEVPGFRFSDPTKLPLKTSWLKK